MANPEWDNYDPNNPERRIEALEKEVVDLKKLLKQADDDISKATFFADKQFRKDLKYTSNKIRKVLKGRDNESSR